MKPHKHISSYPYTRIIYHIFIYPTIHISIRKYRYIMYGPTFFCWIYSERHSYLQNMMSLSISYLNQELTNGDTHAACLCISSHPFRDVYPIRRSYKWHNTCASASRYDVAGITNHQCTYSSITSLKSVKLSSVCLYDFWGSIIVPHRKSNPKPQ